MRGLGAAPPLRLAREIVPSLTIPLPDVSCLPLLRSDTPCGTKQGRISPCHHCSGTSGSCSYSHAIADAADAGMRRAVGAAVDGTVCFRAVTDYPASAVCADGGASLYSAFETVECPCTILLHHLKRLVVVVATHIANSHRRSPAARPREHVPLRMKGSCVPPRPSCFAPSATASSVRGAHDGSFCLDQVRGAGHGRAAGHARIPGGCRRGWPTRVRRLERKGRLWVPPANPVAQRVGRSRLFRLSSIRFARTRKTSARRY